MDDNQTSSEPPGRNDAAGEQPGVVSIDVACAEAGLLENSAVEWVSDRAADAAAVLGAWGEVRVRLVGDEEMAAAHQRYSGIAGTTDVLTFDLAEGRAAGSGAGLDVDLLVCVDEAQRQAAQRGLSVEREVLLYIVHGVLHCLGFDDHTEEGAAAMHRREDEVLETIGVGATFEVDGGGGGVEGGGA